MMADRIASSHYSPVSFDVPDERVLDAMVLAIAFRALESMTQCRHEIQKGRPALVAKAAAMESFGVAMSDIFPSSPEASWTVPGGVERVNAALSEFQDRTAEVANLAQQLLDTHDELLWQSDALGDQELDEDLLELKDACDARRRAQEELLRAIGGVSPYQPAPNDSFEARVAETQRIMRDLATAPVTPIRGNQEVPRG